MLGDELRIKLRVAVTGYGDLDFPALAFKSLVPLRVLPEEPLPSVPIWMRHLPYCKLLSRARRSEI